MGVLLLVASAMLAEAYKTYKDDHLCKIWETLGTKGQCKHLLIGVVSYCTHQYKLDFKQEIRIKKYIFAKFGLEKRRKIVHKNDSISSTYSPYKCLPAGPQPVPDNNNSSLLKHKHGTLHGEKYIFIIASITTDK